MRVLTLSNYTEILKPSWVNQIKLLNETLFVIIATTKMSKKFISKSKYHKRHGMHFSSHIQIIQVVNMFHNSEKKCTVKHVPM